MANTIKVNAPKLGRSAEAEFQLPQGLEDPRWAQLVAEGVDLNEAINTLAVRALVVDVQKDARAALAATGEEAAVAIISGYRFGGPRKRVARARKAGVVVTREKVKELKFSAAQIAELKALGVNFGGEEEEAAS